MPVPIIDEDTREFWEACRQHRLVVQQCDTCGNFRFAPAPICFSCHSSTFSWIESEAIGEVYTWIITHRPVHPATRDAVPYNSAVIKLLDCGGALITSNLIDIDDKDIEAGMKVSLVWDDISNDFSLPRFRPV